MKNALNNLFIFLNTGIGLWATNNHYCFENQQVIFTMLKCQNALGSCQVIGRAVD